jgi:hypothetical protein
VIAFLHSWLCTVHTFSLSSPNVRWARWAHAVNFPSASLFAGHELSLIHRNSCTLRILRHTRLLFCSVERTCWHTAYTVHQLDSCDLLWERLPQLSLLGIASRSPAHDRPRGLSLALTVGLVQRSLSVRRAGNSPHGICCSASCFCSVPLVK